MPIVLLEAILRVMHVPPTTVAVDPYIDLHNLSPLFELDIKAQKYRISNRRMNLFRPAEFDAEKGPNTFRVFCLGGSTTQGEPFSTETAFGQWLQLNLQIANPERPIEVINCGGLSYASYRVRNILREVLQYGPDLIVVYTGQNEFLEKRTYQDWQSVPAAYTSARHSLTNLLIVRWINYLSDKVLDSTDSQDRFQVTNRTAMAAEVDALLDYQGGLEAYHRDDPWREPVINHFRWNLGQMIVDCQSARVPLILMRPVVNLLDCPPFKFETDATLDAETSQRFTEAWQTAQGAHGDLKLVRSALDDLLQLDPHHAGAWYFLGRIQWEQHEWKAAKESLEKAVDTDVCPLRATLAIRQIVTELADEFAVPLVDAEQIFSDASEHSVVGNKWLVDHVHPTVEGHRVLGEALSEVCIQQGWLEATRPHWRNERAQAYRQHLNQLGEAYFHRGQQRLEGLRLWTQGRAKKVRPQ